MPEMRNDKDIEHDVEVIKEWLCKQSHLPTNIDERFIRRFLFCCNHSLEKSKNLIDLCYTVRAQAPEIFAKRDPKSPAIKNTLKLLDLIPLPKVTANNYKLFIYRLADYDPDKYFFIDVLKTFLMVADVRLINGDEYPDGEVPIFDMTGFSLKHVSKVVLPALKKYMVYVQEAHPVRMKQIHVINVPTFLDKLLVLIKPFMKNEVAQMLHFHLPNSTTLYDYVPKELLPEDYGGQSGKICDLKAEWINRVMEHRDYYLDESRWKVDESKRLVQNNNGKQLFGMEGSFRSLSID